VNKTFLIELLVLTFSSCRIPYEPDIDTDQEILVVDAFLTNHTGASYVKLSMAIPYDLDRNYPGVQNATVYLTDGNHNLISFSETSVGYYEPVDTLFAGEINITYKLTVKMPDGEIYFSEPETIPEDIKPDSAYGGYDQVEYLTVDEFGKTVRVIEDVCALYFDYMGEALAPRFRYNSSQLIQFVVSGLSGDFYCWRTLTDNNLRFTDEKYTSSSINIHKQEVSTSPPLPFILAYDIVRTPSGEWVHGDSMLIVYEDKRIVEVNQYRLNEDSYAYYKNVKTQSDAEGKLFDPVISQLKGNMSCVNVSSKTVLGFFEASNLKTMSYIISRTGVGSKVTITRIDNVAPHPPAGFMVNEKPDFWVY
jgi:hypothetical protein